MSTSEPRTSATVLDFSPIEKFWGDVTRSLGRLDPETVADVLERLQEMFAP
jgi:hypothetical protein